VRWRTWLRVAQIIVTIILIGLLLRQVRWADLRTLVNNLGWSLVVLSTILVLISHLVNVARWRYLLQHHATGYGRLLVFYGAGLFSNNFLPTGIGGDGVRVALLSRCVPLPRAIFSVGLDRAIGLLALSAFLVPGLWFGLPPGLEMGSSRLTAIPDAWRTLLAVLLVVVEVGLVGLVVWRRLPSLRTMALRASAQFPSFGSASQWTRGRWLRLLSCAYALSVASQIGLVLANWGIIRALGIQISPGAAIWLVLVGSVALLLPITVNGLGLQEGIYVVLLTSYGVATTAALGVALCARILTMSFSLLGGLLSLRWRYHRDSPTGSSCINKQEGMAHLDCAY